MKVYVLTESYRNYDAGSDEVLGVYATLELAQKMKNYFDMALELEYANPRELMWGKYHNYEYYIDEYNVEEDSV